jgi:hypothetical protein
MKNLFVLCTCVILLCLINCKRESDNSTIVSTHIDIAYKDAFGNDLLNESNQNYYSKDNIHVYTIINGVKTDVYNNMMAYPRDFMIYKNDELNSYFIRFFLESDTVLVKLNQNTTDTIISTIDTSNGNQILRKLWYNGSLKWEFGVEQVITIVK